MNRIYLTKALLTHIKYKIYGGDKIIAYDDGDGFTKLCYVKKAIRSGRNAPLLNLSFIPDHIDLVSAVCEDTNIVWLFPFTDIEGLKVVRLGKRWDDYKYNISISVEREMLEEEARLKQATTDLIQSVLIKEKKKKPLQKQST